jgi:neutral ceramidase
MPRTPPSLSALLLAALLPACTDDAPARPDATVDAPTDAKAPDAAPDAPPPMPVSTAHCTYAPLPPTGNATGMVEAGALRAGAAEAMLDLPVGSMLGAYTSRGRAYGGETHLVDAREVPYAGGFVPSFGYERAPRVKAVALSAGGETVVILKADLGAADDLTTIDVAAALGPSFAGKVIFATNHSHSAWGHHMSNEVLGLGFGSPRAETHRKLVDALVGVARRALDGMVPARIGIAHDDNFDPMNLVSRDRRDDNDDLPNGRNRKDRDLFLIRVDRMDGTALAMLPVFGIHGTVLGDDNNLASAEAPGGIEWVVEESFDRNVVVMHLQGAAGDVSPAGSGGINCMGQRTCYNFARVESVGQNAVAPIRAAWERAGAAMTDRVAMEMLTREVPLGPDWRTFSVRGGALTYAPFEAARECDGRVFDGMSVVSPIDEFNAPYGAGLCGDRGRSALPSSAQMPGTFQVLPYRSCSRVEAVAPFLGPLFNLDIPTMPCGATRTMVSSLRINDHLFITLPGEPVTLLADRVRAASPNGVARTAVIGYAQGHMGYLLHAEDWLRGGYEPSINLWGPLEGEYIAERAVELARLAVTPARENSADGSTYWRPTAPAAMPPPAAAPRAGTVPTSLPATMFYPSVSRGAMRPTTAQPETMVPRLGLARFTWIGEDPQAGTARVTLQREQTAGRGDFADVTRRSGRPVQDGDLLVAWTPDPLTGAAARTHYWTVEWQAVAPVGSAYPDALSGRPGVALGRYRFHVEGTGYRVDSDPFTVTAGALAVTATRMGTSLQVNVGYEARTGWRLLDFQTDSNRRVPVRSSPVDLTLTTMAGATRTLRAQMTDASGVVTVPMAADVRTVAVTDRHGNAGSATP